MEALIKEQEEQFLWQIERLKEEGLEEVEKITK